MDSSYLLFVGSYTNFDILAHLPHNDKTGRGVYCLQFNNGNVELVTTISSENPAVISCHPKNPNTLYILNEGIINNGIIQKIDISSSLVSFNDADKQYYIDLKVLNEEKVPTQGRSLCYFNIHPTYNQYGIAVNYWEGNIDVFLMDEKTGSCKKIIQHIDHMDIALNENKQRRLVVNREDHWNNRQVGSHAHSIHFYKQWVFIPDLGENSIFQYRFEPNNNPNILEYECQIYLEEGAGPRHMVFHPTLPVAYVSNELNSTITVLLLDNKIENYEIEKENKDIRQRMKIIQNIPTSKEDLSAKKNYVAEVCISPDGQNVYVSNRGHDVIGIYKVDFDNMGILINIDYISVYGKCPRHFNITPDGKYLLVCNQDSNSLTVFERNTCNGLLKYHNIFTNELFGAPNYITFHPSPMSQMLIQQQQQKKQQKKKSQEKICEYFGKNKKDINVNRYNYLIERREYVWGIVLLCFAFMGMIVNVSKW